MSETMDPLGLAERSSPTVGSAHLINPDPVIAGQFGTWQLVFTVGPDGLDTGGIVRIGTDSDTDWGLPQLHDPTAAEYLTVTPPSDAEVATQVPDLVTVLVINTGRPLNEGETIHRHIRRPVPRWPRLAQPDLHRTPTLLLDRSRYQRLWRIHPHQHPPRTTHHRRSSHPPSRHRSLERRRWRRLPHQHQSRRPLGQSCKPLPRHRKHLRRRHRTRHRPSHLRRIRQRCHLDRRMPHHRTR